MLGRLARGLWTAAAAVSVVALLGAAVHVFLAPGSARQSRRLATSARTELSNSQLEGLSRFVASVWRGASRRQGNGIGTSRKSERVYAAVRAQGARLAEGWSDPGDLGRVLRALLQRLREQVKDRRPEVDCIELCLTHGYRLVPARAKGWPKQLANDNRGVLGLEVWTTAGPKRFSPTQMLAENLDFRGALRQVLEVQEHGQWRPAAINGVRTFACHQVLISLGRRRAVRMFRGNVIVDIETVTKANVEQLKRGLEDWLLNNLAADGRMRYAYFPGLERESKSNNMIRQWMASIALVRVARDRGDDPVLLARAQENISYNLTRFFHQEGALGLIEYEDTVKLGAVALAALAIFEHPTARERFFQPFQSLLRTTYQLQRSNGSFQNFHKPARQRGLHNYYPGETLLLWASVLADQPKTELLSRFMRSFRYYRSWHRAHRHPAFVPWHTQAYYRLWRQTGDPELKAFIFEMNDWLCDFQQWTRVSHPDLAGRFYDAERSQFGPPHASATGVYLEGLIDAYSLAKEVNDSVRRLRYRRAIVRGLRSTMQLQFADEVDMFYVKQRRLVRGGLRTTVYNNKIRVDNVQHALMAIQRIHRLFESGDYSTHKANADLENEFRETRAGARADQGGDRFLPVRVAHPECEAAPSSRGGRATASG